MNWCNLYWQRCGGLSNPRASSRLMAAAWRAVADWPDETLAQTLVMNTCDPQGVLNNLDWRGVPVPPELLGA